MKKLLFTLAIITSFWSHGQDRFKGVEITTTQITDQVYMLQGAGGNILIQVSENEVVMIDSQFAPLSEKIKEAIKNITDSPIRYLINTHHHGDHTGGNGNFNTEETIVIAHKNVLTRLQESEKEERFFPEKTIEEDYELSLPDDNNLIIHVHNAHTDGDSFIYLTKSNVVHMGDVFFNGRYPYIDLKSGGSISGYIAAQKKVLSTINEETKIVPGHGPLGSYDDLAAYIPMLEDLKKNIKKAISDGKTRAQVEKNTSLTRKYDAAGFGDGFINSSKIRTTIYDSLILESEGK
ncbi:glyoxylase-like metal-dependent hydrolase (beta-lactamase superfamily II) [Nonlabens dokdonensis]|jgi:glyoxylase-like metal-dependent hydrolase (beta-lactamase superfamily II)|uniref:Glyoxylase-like metal-dependent hydrolase (Beta-lactamase superfamily II) n=2 Tax=Nonlabens dokdonensis TaxID=328515 RepID=A0ABX5PWF9_9FLAO|nr:MBL fold metallo-hydrolase [Nonlabens dokdonensis]AGC75142.1 putative metallo-beta-lactamase superfamily protein [Nonlabens dokdonensis DSW-6]PZX39115.1 glyoxylase-like metal-dependent hydrolase (beta-lactamase superfamily II) [Nonlabens dokdonensis]